MFQIHSETGRGDRVFEEIHSTVNKIQEVAWDSLYKNEGRFIYTHMLHCQVFVNHLRDMKHDAEGLGRLTLNRV